MSCCLDIHKTKYFDILYLGTNNQSYAIKCVIDALTTYKTIYLFDQ